MAYLESVHFYIQTIYVCLCEKAKSVTMEMKRHNTIGDRVNIVFCPQTNVPKCSLSLVRVCATAAVCVARWLREGHLHPLFMAKPIVLTTSCYFMYHPLLTLYTFFPIWCVLYCSRYKKRHFVPEEHYNGFW